MATNGGLVRFDPAGTPMFTPLAAEGPDPRAKIGTVLLEDRDGTIWSGTTNGLYRLERTASTLAVRAVDIGIPHEYGEQAIVSALIEARDGSLWIGTPNGLYRRGGGRRR